MIDRPKAPTYDPDDSTASRMLAGFGTDLSRVATFCHACHAGRSPNEEGHTCSKVTVAAHLVTWPMGGVR